MFQELGASFLVVSMSFLGIWGISKIRGPLLVVSTIRNIVYWGLPWGSLFFGNSLLGYILYDCFRNMDHDIGNYSGRYSAAYLALRVETSMAALVSDGQYFW